VDEWTRLRRFLILGSEGGSYYASERKLTHENAQAVERAVEADGKRAVAEIIAVSREGRAPKNDPALFALALAAGVGDEKTRTAALDPLPQLARTSTHLFSWRPSSRASAAGAARCVVRSVVRGAVRG
jgi:60 kDa SS-A/Ro ribonucleoprotein